MAQNPEHHAIYDLPAPLSSLDWKIGRTHTFAPHKVSLSVWIATVAVADNGLCRSLGVITFARTIREVVAPFDVRLDSVNLLILFLLRVSFFNAGRDSHPESVLT